MLLLLIGFICLLLVIGFFTEMGPISFTVIGLVTTGALCFIAFLDLFVWFAIF